MYNNIPTLPRIEIEECCRMIANIDENTNRRSEIALLAIINNHLPCLKQSITETMNLPTGSIQYAAASGNISMLNFIIEQGVPWNYTLCSKENFDGLKKHLDLYRYVHKDACKLNHDWIKKSVHYGSLEFLNEAHDLSCLWRKNSFMLALSKREDLGLVKNRTPNTLRQIWTTTKFLEPFCTSDQTSDSDNSRDSDVPYFSAGSQKCKFNPDVNLINAIRYCMDFIQENVEILKYNQKGNSLKTIKLV